MKWKKINEILPEETKEILLYSKTLNITIIGHIYKNYSDEYLVSSASVVLGTPLDVFTHWMDIPDIPR